MEQALREFISTIVNTRAKLELVLHFQENPHALETLETLAGRLSRREPTVAEAVMDLVEAGILAVRVAGENHNREVYTYDPASPFGEMVTLLARALEGPQRNAVLAAVAESDMAQRRHQLAQMRHLDDLKARFVSMVSHELRTPVTIIKGIIVALLTRQETPVDRQRELLRVANRRCGELILLIEDLLCMAGIQSGERLARSLGKVSLAELIHLAVSHFDRENPQHHFEVRVPDDLPLIVADARHLQQVLVDLLDNAVKFSPDGGRVLITVERTDPDVLVTVEDEGIGLAATEFERVFDRFYQVEPPATRRAGGCGIGLYLAQRIIEEHGGRIWLETKPTRGLRVKFTLPIAGPAVPEEENGTVAPPSPTSADSGG